MSSPPPNTSLPLSSAAPAPAVLTPEEVSGVLRDLTQAVQEIRLFLAGSYGPHQAAPPIAATASPWLPWLPPHQAAPAALAGPLQLPSTTPPWLQRQPPLLARPPPRSPGRCSCHPPPRPGCSGSRRSWWPPPRPALRRSSGPRRW
nr:proline-rich protein 36-like [Aegilops tauschii subsp. strangulata]